MGKKFLDYSLPADTSPTKPKLRHRVDCETLQGIIQRIESRNKEENGYG